MARNRLIKALENFDATVINKVFDGEDEGFVYDPAADYAPIQRVAIFAEAFLPKVDGVTKSAYLTMRYLQETGREVIIFAPDVAPTQIGPTRIVPLPSVGVPVAPETRIALPAAVIRKELDDFKPDLIHLFSPVLMSISGLYEGRQRHIPVVANYQTDLPGYARKHYGMSLLAEPVNRWLRYIHNHCHINLVASETVANNLRKDGYRRLHIWRRGIDTHRFSPDNRDLAWRERLLNGRDPNALICVYVGRLAREKRIDLLLEVAKTPGVALTIIGDGAAREELEEMFAGTDTYFTGYLYGEELSHAYASADVFVFPGPNETFGQVVQEGMASGLPAVIINQGGIVDLVEDGVNGFHCNDDPHTFREAVIKLRDNDILRKRMGNESRYRATRYPWPAIMRELEDYYIRAVEVNERLNRMYPPMPWLQRLTPVAFERLGSP
ncbi:MAG: glycosyltransferase family 1 protein [Chloroflexi bacterium]|nr:glycosyltransferase family 1 protein [Chloroflexota bacterium]